MQEHPFYLTWMNNHAIIHISATHIFTVFFVVFFYDGNRCRHVSDMFLLHIANKRGASVWGSSIALQLKNSFEEFVADEHKFSPSVAISESTCFKQQWEPLRCLRSYPVTLAGSHRLPPHYILVGNCSVSTPAGECPVAPSKPIHSDSAFSTRNLWSGFTTHSIITGNLSVALIMTAAIK